MTAILTAVAVAAASAFFGFLAKIAADWSKREKAKAEIFEAGAEADKVDEARYEAIDALRIGVTTISETIVKGLKDAAADGKIHKGEIKDIQKAALNEAIKIATSPDAIEFLTKTAFDTIAAIISGIVQGKKSKE